MEVQHHYSDKNGRHFVASFFSDAERDRYVPPDGAMQIAPPPSENHVWQDGGWTFVAPPEPFPPTPTDYVLTDRQLRLGLISAGVLPSTVRNSIAASLQDNDFERETMLTWFDFTRDVHWDHPVTQQLMAIAGFTPEQAATMWLAAAQIDA